MQNSGGGRASTHRSALGTLVAVVSAILVPVHADAEAAEVVAALQDDGVLEIIQTDRTCELLLPVLCGSGGRHVHGAAAAAAAICGK